MAKVWGNAKSSVKQVPNLSPCMVLKYEWKKKKYMDGSF